MPSNALWILLATRQYPNSEARWIVCSCGSRTRRATLSDFLITNSAGHTHSCPSKHIQSFSPNQTVVAGQGGMLTDPGRIPLRAGLEQVWGQELGRLSTLVLPRLSKGMPRKLGRGYNERRRELPNDRSLYVWNNAPPTFGCFLKRCETAENYETAPQLRQ